LPVEQLIKKGQSFRTQGSSLHPFKCGLNLDYKESDRGCRSLKFSKLTPQVTSGEWSKSYLAEQLWRCYLGLPSDYDWSDLDLIAKKQILE
jgi:hypothetical protein